MPPITNWASALGDIHFSLNDINILNVIVGRNGAGKSRFLRNIKQHCERDLTQFKISYISPERVGLFKQDPNTDMNIINGGGWLNSVRNKNQSENFKNASAYMLRQLEVIFLRRMESEPALRQDLTKTFMSEYLNKINTLLTNVSIVQNVSTTGVFIFQDHNGQPVLPENLSSGESEAISLASEIMNFIHTIEITKINVLAIDEPDVHMHPDLQARFARFLIKEISALPPNKKERIIVLLATHSTPLICELARYECCSLGTKHFSNDKVILRVADNHLKNAAAFFAHPLSKSISDDPLVILEGTDDERVWQQAVRTANGNIKLFPCLAYTVNQQTELETFCSQLLPAIYDEPVAFSLRDGDGRTTALNSIGCVQRFRLQCYSIENLLLTDECLSSLNSTWEGFRTKANEWLTRNTAHKDVQLLRDIIADTGRFRHTKIKDVRQLICVILDSNKPWEVVVGQTIGNFKRRENVAAHSLEAYMGTPFMMALNFPIAPAPAPAPQQAS